MELGDLKVTASGIMVKMKGDWSSAAGPMVSYTLPLREAGQSEAEFEKTGAMFSLELNHLLGRYILLRHTGRIFDLYSGELIKKSYGQGYSFDHYRSLARCDSCIFSPEKCHFERGTCREPEWAKKNCFTPHVIYLAVSSDLKVGITRASQIPTRFIDQGASYALPILKVSDRKSSGMVEVAIKEEISDKTNWKKMLTAEIQNYDLIGIRNQLFHSYGEVFEEFDAEEFHALPTHGDVLRFTYPLVGKPKQILSWSFDKSRELGGTLLGIKGQYLIFENGVLNLRKYQGYEIDFIVTEKRD